MVIQRIMALLSRPPTSSCLFSAKVILLRCNDASVPFKEMAESSINHCLVLAHLPSVFCIPRHHFQSLPSNWGE